MNYLVAYFSATGTTKDVALKINGEIKGDIYEIIPKVVYTTEDLEWNDSTSRTTYEKNNPLYRPDIKERIDISNYNVIFLGFPVWWYKAPNIVYTFLDSYDFTGKVVIPFCTSGSSSIDSSMDALIKDYPNIKFVRGKRLSIDDDISSWIKEVVK